MRPSMETIHDPSNLEYINEGKFAKVYRQEDGSVLKISSEHDGTMDYIEWCWLRLKKYGKGSFEMAQFPEVEHFGRVKFNSGDEGWWCVMPEYVHCIESPQALKLGGDITFINKWGRREHIYTEAVRSALFFLTGLFKWTWTDMHSGNVMWDPSRNQWVITDPCADNATGSASSLAQAERFKLKKVASWKRTPLQCLQQRC